MENFYCTFYLPTNSKRRGSSLWRRRSPGPGATAELARGAPWWEGGSAAACASAWWGSRGPLPSWWRGWYTNPKKTLYFYWFINIQWINLEEQTILFSSTSEQSNYFPQNYNILIKHIFLSFLISFERKK